MTQNSADHDVVIIGGGPAGISAAIWCADLGLDAILLEKADEFGGQLLRIYNAIRNYPGVETENGRELRDLFLKQLEKTNINCRTGAEIVSADLSNKKVTLADGSTVSGKTIIIATGVRRRKLGVPGEEEFAGRGVLDSGVRSKHAVAGKRVVIVGGGDAAIENALILSETADHVTVVHRRDRLTARGEFVEELSCRTNIEVLFNSTLERIEGPAAVASVKIGSGGPHRIMRRDCEAVLVRIGVRPNSELFTGQIELDPIGYIKVDANCTTGRAGIFAIGDVASPNAQTISTAVGTGATAVKAVAAMI